MVNNIAGTEELECLECLATAEQVVALAKVLHGVGQVNGDGWTFLDNGRLCR